MNKAADKERVGYLVVDMARLFGRVFDRRASHLEITRVQWRALKRIGCQPGITQVELADLLDMEPIAVGRVIDRLQKAGFVERRADPSDRRVWRLHPTTQSAQIMDDAEAVARSLREDTLAGIGADELAAAMDVFGRIRDTLIQLDHESRGEPSSKS